MTTSGTTAFNLDIADLIEEAFERAGVEARSGYDFRTARRSLDLMTQEWANRGLNLWTVEEGSQPLTEGIATYVLPPDTVDLIEIACRTGSGDMQQDIVLQRISVTDYANIPAKNDRNRPYQVFIQRTITPQFTLWPVPDGAGPYTVAYWRLRRIQDSGVAASNTMDLPFRFVPALVAGLSYYVAMKKNPDIQRVTALKAVYDEQYQLAADEDRDRASIRMIPWVD
jgi:hypothetical protein